MGFADDLTAEVVKIFKEPWTAREGRQVPDTTDLALRNDAVTLKGTVLYADLADSTGLVSGSTPTFAAEVYKTYLNCACRIIRANGGEITAFDGDRVMAVYLGEAKNTAAMKSALQINHAVVNIINPKLKEQYPNSTFVVRQAVGIDTSDLFVARTGIRGSNDLVWVGTAANTAAKLCSLREGNFASWVSDAVYQGAANEVKTSHDGRAMWEVRSWTARGGITVYGSKWTWTP
jgi:class 3 adenylate cyclase